MTESPIALALSEAADWILGKSKPAHIELALEEDPQAQGRVVYERVRPVIDAESERARLYEGLESKGYVLLDNAFSVEDVPDTPIDFLPVPLCKTTLRARLAAVGLHSFFGKETIAYRSENRGGLFVNLVAMPGQGRIPEKSTNSLRGHTDACSFPFPGALDAEDPRISPSPDLVTLIGLKNPDGIPTHVIPLDAFLSQLGEEDIRELERQQFIVECQNTFPPGTQVILAEPHIAIDVEVLRRVGGLPWVRFSHSKVKADPENTAAERARAHFTAACERQHIPVHIAPGSLLIINNHRALHGRSAMKKEVAGNTRWLLRTYALDPAAIQPESRYLDSAYHLFP